MQFKTDSVTLRINFEHTPVRDGTTGDVFIWNEDTETYTEVGTMIYSADLHQWNDCLNPGEVSGETAFECATKMIELYNK